MPIIDSGSKQRICILGLLCSPIIDLRPSTLRGLKGKRVFSDILVWRRWVWLASALLGHSMRHRWQLWFVQMFASRDQNRQLAIWVCLVRRLLNWRPPTRRAMKGKRVISVADGRCGVAALCCGGFAGV